VIIRIFSVFVSYFFLISLTFVSCKQDAKCDCEADTMKISKIFQPDGISGKDAMIESIDPDKNSGNLPVLSAFAWTDTGYFNSARTLLEFDLSVIPVLTKIKSAKLSLYFSAYDNLTEQTGDNAFSIYRISQEWDKNTVTWNNQPVISNLDSVAVSKSTSVLQSYISIDVTALVQDMVSYPSLGHGFMLKLDQEFPYKLVVLASSRHNDKSKHPKLIVYY
jgi:Disaggregatase related repeat